MKAEPKDNFIWSDCVKDGGEDITGKKVRYARIPDYGNPYVETFPPPHASFAPVVPEPPVATAVKIASVFLDNGETIYRRQIKEVLS